jgi:hypothetical protein
LPVRSAHLTPQRLKGAAESEQIWRFSNAIFIQAKAA